MSAATLKYRDQIPIALLFLSIPWLMIESLLLVNAYESDILLILLSLQAIKYSLLLIPPIYWILSYGIDWRWFKFFLMLLALIFAYSTLSFVQGIETKSIINSIKNVYFWPLYFLLIVSAKFSFRRQTLSVLLWTTTIFSLINIVYSIFINYSFSNVDQFYFYNLYNSKNIFNEWDFIRDGEVRAFGFMGSPLTLSQTLIIALCFSFSGITRTTSIENILYFFILFLIILFGIYLTRTRNPVVGVFCALFLMYSGRTFRLSRRSVFFLFFAIYIAVILLVFEMSRRGLGDLSSQARAPMLIAFFNLIYQNPFGYGIGSTGVSLPSYAYFFESSAATVFMDLGIVGGLIFWGIIFKALLLIWGESRIKHKAAWMKRAVFLSLAALLFITNFSNIFDSSLLIFSILSAAAVKTISPRSSAAQSLRSWHVFSGSSRSL